jgi:2-C-methyl-D-erythritol 2,4-cyclodiphosphate synthase
MFRIGHGFDQHPFREGRPLWLGGVEIASPDGLAGHSDGDVIVHALCNALLGAIGQGDLGGHFPSSDPQWKGVASMKLLKAVLVLVRPRFEVVNVDLTVIASRPVLAAHLPKMRSALSGAVGVPEERLNVKASNPEGIGGLGKGEGIAAQCVVLLRETAQGADGAVS